MKRIKSVLMAAILAASVLLVVSPAQAHGTCGGGGDVWTGANYLRGVGLFQCSEQHSTIVADFTLQQKPPGGSWSAVFGPSRSSCFSCKQVSKSYPPIGVERSCTHGYSYRMKIVGKAANHTSQTFYSATEVLC